MVMEVPAQALHAGQSRRTLGRAVTATKAPALLQLAMNAAAQVTLVSGWDQAPHAHVPARVAVAAPVVQTLATKVTVPAPG
jgi:hypothetical protein